MKTESAARVALRIRSVVASTSGNDTAVLVTTCRSGDSVVDTTAMAALRVCHGQVPGVRGDQQITAEVEVTLPRRGLVALLDLACTDLDVGDDRAPLLGESGLIERANLTARDPAGRAQDLRQGLRHRCRPRR